MSFSVLDYTVTVGNARILVACAMKSGSTFIAKVLALYFGVERIEPVPYWGRLEQHLDEHLLAPYLGGGFALQMHLLPHMPNLELIRKHGIAVVRVWRNLGDVLVSFDDHIRNEDHRNPVCYVHDRDRYLAMPLQRRYRYLIDHAVPWYIGFWLSWRQVRSSLPVAEAHYEDLARDPSGCLSRMVEGLGEVPDGKRLDAILACGISGTRFNRGVNGRSVALLSAENKQRLEDLLLDHCEDLSPLYEELPWRNAAPGARRRSRLMDLLRDAARRRAARRRTRQRT